MPSNTPLQVTYANSVLAKSKTMKLAGRQHTQRGIEIQLRGLRAERKDVEWAGVLGAINQARVRKRVEGLGKGVEEIEDVTHRKKGE